MLLHSPIIFLGYSLTDRNVRKIIKDFTCSLSEEEKLELEKRLIVVQWESDMKEIEEEVKGEKEQFWAEHNEFGFRRVDSGTSAGQPNRCVLGSSKARETAQGRK